MVFNNPTISSELWRNAWSESQINVTVTLPLWFSRGRV